MQQCYEMAKTASEAAPSYDVLIVGGSVAGLSAALTLGRSLRRVLVLDAGQPCNRYSPHAHNLFTQDGTPPAQLLAAARQQALAYPTVRIEAGLVTRLHPTGAGFEAETAVGQRFASRKVLLATGVRDLLPPLPGFAECWGQSIVHCPYCHGYEVHGQPLAVLGNGEGLVEHVQHLRNWGRDLLLFTNGPATFGDDQRQQLAQLQVPVIETPVVGFAHAAGQLQAVQLADGRQLPRTALFAAVPFEQSSDLARQLGCTLTATGLLQVSEFGATNIPGVVAAGDNSTAMRSLPLASSRAVLAAIWLNRELVQEDCAA